MEKQKYKVSVIIPNYNRKDHLERLLPSIAGQSFDDYEVIIIDDSSPDRAAVEYIRSFIKTHEHMRLIENTENLGFVKTCNKGFRLASGDYICLLTNDTDVTIDFVEKNVDIMEADNSIGALSCIIVDDKGEIWFSGGSIKVVKFDMNLRDDFEGIRPVDYVAGTACFYRKNVFDEVGYLNENYVMYHEDVEFCLRIKNKTNYRACMFSDKLVTHFKQGQQELVPEKIYYLHRNLLFLTKQYFPESLPKILSRHYLRFFSKMIGTAIRRRDYRYFLIAKCVVKGVFHGLAKTAQNE